MKRDIGLLCFVVLIFISLFLCSSAANADETYPFTSILCLKEVGYLQVRVVNIPDVYSSEHDALTHAKFMQDKYNLFYESFTKFCKIDGKSYKISVRFETPRARGMCDGSEAQGHLYVFLDGKVILKDLPYDRERGCWSNNVESVSISSDGLEICGQDSSSYYKQYCVDYGFSKLLNGNPVTDDRLYKDFKKYNHLHTNKEKLCLIKT